MYEFGPIKEKIAKTSNTDASAARRSNGSEEKGVTHFFSHRFYQSVESEQRSRLPENRDIRDQCGPADN